LFVENAGTGRETGNERENSRGRKGNSFANVKFAQKKRSKGMLYVIP